MPKLKVIIKLETQAKIDALYRICQRDYAAQTERREYFAQPGEGFLETDFPALETAKSIMALLEPMTKEVSK